ncbi:hypothetical protein RYA05_13575 [Pseudomonas syringae pv. actinidiae]|nr:hypothetical protein [Pseudomonas syringae pv. actinidiae]
MKGKIISIDHAKRFGFVEGDGQISHHFSIGGFDNKDDFSGLRIGSMLIFQSTAGPKGMKAINVKRVPEYPYLIAPEKRLITEKEHPLRDSEVIILEQYVQTPFSRSPIEAKEMLTNLAHQQPFNLIRGMQSFTREFQERGHSYTMHSYGGWLGAYLKTEYSEDPTLTEKYKKYWHDEFIPEKRPILEKIKKEYDSVRYAQVNNITGISLVIGVLLIAVLFFAVMT